MEVNMKKFIAILLMIALSVTLLAACNNDAEESSAAESSQQVNDSSETISTDPDSEWKDAEGNWKPKHEVKDLSDKTFTIIVRGSIAGTYQSDDFTTGEDTSGLYGDLLDSAVTERNNMVEQIYHVTLNVIRSDSIQNDIVADISSSLGQYDAVMPTMTSLAALASDNYLVELSNIDGFDIHAPWYDESATSAFSIMNKVYFTTGDITILNKVCSPAVLFNKSMLETYHLEDPYELVKNHQWTFDKLEEMAKSVCTNGNASNATYDDYWTSVYGMLTTNDDPFNFWGATGELLVEKDANDLPVLSIGSDERSISVASHLLEEYANGDDWLIYANNSTAFGTNIWVTSLDFFAEGHALFRPSAFSATTKLRKNYDFAFGILPLPLYNTNQEEYVSYCGSSQVAGIAIPTSAPDIDFSAYMIDAYSAYAKTYITRAYKDVNLYKKDASFDNESSEMLDIIFDNIVYDMGECYDIGGIKGQFSSLVANRSTDIVSALAAIESTAESKIEQIIEAYEN